MPVLRCVMLAGLGLAVSAGPVLAQKVDEKKFLEEVRSIVLPEEEKTFKGLKDKGDREEFVRIFWARRDPDLDTPENEFKTQFEKARAEADQKFAGAGRPGASTDCGRVFILLGPPDEVHVGSGARTKVDTVKLHREPQEWTYVDNPERKIRFAGGKTQIPFDDGCTLPQGARLGEQLNRVAQDLIAQPNLDPTRKTPEGRIVKLADQLPKPTPVMALLKEPRTDFPATLDNSLWLRTPDGASYVAGLLRVEPGVLAPGAAAVVGAQAVTEAGKVAASQEREVRAEAAPGGQVVSYGLALKPGDYTLRVGVLDPASGKGSAIVQPLKVPDYAGDELTLSPVMVLRDVVEAPNPDPKDPLAAFQLGTAKLMPRYGNTFGKDDSVVLLAFIYNAKVDEATGKPSFTSSFTISRAANKQVVARAPEQAHDATPSGPSVGPVPLSSYEPGKYVAEVKVHDNVSKKDYSSRTEFEIR